MISVTAPLAVPRGGRGPSFRITSDGDRFTAVEVAVDPELFAVERRTARADTAGFWGSWISGSLQQQNQITMPAPVWERFKHAERLYYRALSSANADSWVNVERTVLDEETGTAPFIAVIEVAHHPDLPTLDVDAAWSAMISDTQFAAVATVNHAQGAVVRHTFSPQRPMTPRAVRWIGCVAAATDTKVWEAVTQVSLESMLPSGTAVYEESVNVALSLADSLTQLAEPLGRLVSSSLNEFSTMGPVQVWQRLAPPPAEEIGGTVIISAQTGRMLFVATTSWQGGQVLIP